MANELTAAASSKVRTSSRLGSAVPAGRSSRGAGDDRRCVVRTSLRAAKRVHRRGKPAWAKVVLAELTSPGNSPDHLPPGLAADDQCHSGAPWSVPARNAFSSGRRPIRTRPASGPCPGGRVSRSRWKARIESLVALTAPFLLLVGWVCGALSAETETQWSGMPAPRMQPAPDSCWPSRVRDR